MEITEDLDDEAEKSRLYHLSDVTTGDLKEAGTPSKALEEATGQRLSHGQARQKTG